MALICVENLLHLLVGKRSPHIKRKYVSLGGLPFVRTVVHFYFTAAFVKVSQFTYHS
jgi:hypothetical protein